MKKLYGTMWVTLLLFLTVILLFNLTYAKLSARAGEIQTGISETHSPGVIFTVNDPADPGEPTCTELQCSLRAAILAANADGIAAGHIIDFNLTFPVTITLNSPLPVISSTLSMYGNGPSQLTLSGNGQYLGLEVGPGASLSISEITIRQGYGVSKGAGILNDHGVMYLYHVVFANNLNGGGEGGGFYNDGGEVTIYNSTFWENDAFHHGAISNHGVMTITNSTFTDNSARIGGAISNNGTLTIRNSTFSGNIATQIGGGAIDNHGALTVVNSTFFQNGSTYGADILNGGPLHITNSTFFSPTLPSLDSLHFGISQTVTVSNTIFAAGNGIANCGGDGIGIFGPDNLATDSTCNGATLVTFDQLKLGDFQNNGGETSTLALLQESVAINAGNDTICAALIGFPFFGAGGEDQREILRPKGKHCDVGAFEQNFLYFFYLPNILYAANE